ncbi:S66 family peptidase [Cohnella nanjingensis]|uniref:LD-carboxypeptidase n=1 Tax=Cohnella nanjingensis TaxID=1387779 RepID=A0A7X0RUY0_9BACL|nr:S66 peptidase family protein [Cohnella nanjingensis]MBB6674016.1 LD-carboxypeptidase [Cohnella nanjingensis]
MSRIQYPAPLRAGDTIGVTAPSSGVEPHLHDVLARSKAKVERLGFQVVYGDTVWQNGKCVSASAARRAAELQQFLLHAGTQAVIPPWGGEFLMDILPLIDWASLRARPPKWLLGYSDLSTFMFACTLLTGHATAHGPNYADIGSDQPDATADRWLDVLATPALGTVRQRASAVHRSSWSAPAADAPTRWETLGGGEAAFRGRLIGGCMDTISVLIGTPYAPVETFARTYAQDEGLVWYLESCEMNAADLYRHLWQFRANGWFERTNGVLIGRPAGYSAVKDFELADALRHVYGDLPFPVVHGVDVGHVPPQLTLVNGAVAVVRCADGQGEIAMTFA